MREFDQTTAQELADRRANSALSSRAMKMAALKTGTVSALLWYFGARGADYVLAILLIGGQMGDYYNFWIIDLRAVSRWRAAYEVLNEVHDQVK